MLTQIAVKEAILFFSMYVERAEVSHRWSAAGFYSLPAYSVAYH